MPIIELGFNIELWLKIKDIFRLSWSKIKVKYAAGWSKIKVVL